MNFVSISKRNGGHRVRRYKMGGWLLLIIECGIIGLFISICDTIGEIFEKWEKERDGRNL
jgi:hypothetical protein